MRRLGLRALGVVVGVTLFAFYVALAAASYWLLTAFVTAPLDLTASVVLLAALTVGFGFLSYRFGTRRLLAGVDATPLPVAAAPGVHRRLDRLTDRMDVARPSLLVADLGAPNAFALGGVRGGVLVVDASLFRLLDADEFEALLAHELAHLRSHDGLVQTIAYSATRTVVGVVVFVLLPVVLLVTGAARADAWIRSRPTTWRTSPLSRLRVHVDRVVALVLVALTLLVRAHSRRREFAADAAAADATGNPLALARALRRIERASPPRLGLLSTLSVRGDAEASLTRLFSTHPPMDDRVERLIERAEEQGLERAGGWTRIEVR